MNGVLQTITLIAAVLLGLLGGALLILALGFVPYWKSLSPNEFTTLFQANTPFVAAAMIPIGFSATGLTLLAFALSQWKKRSNRHWLSAAAAFVVCMFVSFPLYFKETNGVLAAGTLSSEEVTNTLIQWSYVHWVRTMAAIAACICAVRACMIPSHE